MATETKELAYCDGLLEAHHHLLSKHKDVFVIGQGLWSPWYVGNSMKDLDKIYGKERVIDTPVSEDATTAVAVGAALCGYRPLVVHPRVDFMILASNSIVNQAAKWSHMLGGQARPGVTFRGIVNRGGEQGAQHSQALHSWYAHIPGLRVVMPATASDARDLLVASVLSPDPVVYIDDRWCYERTDLATTEIEELDLSTIQPKVLRQGTDVTLVGSSFSTHLALDAAKLLEAHGVHAEVIDLRVVNPWEPAVVVESVRKTGRLVAVDGSWANCGMAAEIIASVVERLEPSALKAKPARVTLPPSPAPTSRALETLYYQKPEGIQDLVLKMLSH